MNKKIRQQFEEQLAYLPTINQEALKAFDWATELVGIGKNYGLHIDELEDLQIETMLLLVGLTSPDNYEKELIERLAIPPSEAEKIIEQINERIFTPIHEYIVNGGNKPTTPATIMESAGLQITDDTPVPTTASPASLVRVGGEHPTGQSLPESKPTPVTPSSPLQFHPSEIKSIQPEVVARTEPIAQKPPIINLSKEKLEQVSQNRQKTIDATLQSMDQIV